MQNVQALVCQGAASHMVALTRTILVTVTQAASLGVVLVKVLAMQVQDMLTVLKVRKLANLSCWSWVDRRKSAEVCIPNLWLFGKVCCFDRNFQMALFKVLFCPDLFLHHCILCTNFKKKTLMLK
jgi:hypothetical protein